jgi:hypothetical protein
MPLERYNKAPFPYYGGKSKAAPLVWQLLGDVDHYVEPFAGALGVLLERPHPCNRPYFSESVNDLDGLLVNSWRAIQWYPDDVAEHASWPVSEADKQARQIACIKWRTERNLDLLAGSPEWCDPRIAGWWLYGVCCQIGAFAYDGPWTVDAATGRIVKQARNGAREPGISRKRPYLTTDGMGVNHGNLREPGISRNLPHLSNNGQGVCRPQLREPGISRDRPHLTDDGQGVNTAATRARGVGDPPEFHAHTMPELRRWMAWLSARLRHVRIVNGDWSRVCTTGALKTLPVRQGGKCGVFVDPPYDLGERSKGLYGHDTHGIADDVRDWCLRNGADKDLRIVVAGFDTEHFALEAHGWVAHEWFSDGWLEGGMGDQAHRERLWASPHCLGKRTSDQFDLFAMLEAPAAAVDADDLFAEAAE